MLPWRAAGPIKCRKSWFYWSFVQLMDESGAVSWIESACFTRLSRIRRRSFPAPIWPPVRRYVCVYIFTCWHHLMITGCWFESTSHVSVLDFDNTNIQLGRVDLLPWLHHVRMTCRTFCTLFWMTAVKSVCGLKPSCVVSTSSTVPKLIWTHSHTQKPCEHRHRRVTCFIKCSIKALHLNTI